MWNALFDRAMTRLMEEGTLDVTFADGRRSRYGHGAPEVAVTLSDPDLPRKLMLTPDVALGEAYMDARLTIGDDDLPGLLALLLANRARGAESGLLRLAGRLAQLKQTLVARNPARRSRSNVAHHYDLSSDLYELFLDEDRQYSCAYWSDPRMTLDAAQAAKKHHIARKLCLRNGHRVLDIGCGWGGMAITLARDYGARVTGVTLSEEQFRIATDRVAEEGLSDRIEIRLQDYRKVNGPFDRIVSVGMFEHVGRAHFDTYFNRLGTLLTPDGIALIHTIGTLTPPRATSPWVRKYIFPGGYIPSLSQASGSIERARLTLSDLEVWRIHYARTLAEWRRRFEDRIDVAEALYDARFCRMWRYYLTAAERSFRDERLVVFQFQLARDNTSVPLTRDYLYPASGASAGMPISNRQTDPASRPQEVTRT